MGQPEGGGLMAEIRKIRTVVDVQVELVLNENELRALDALFGYDLEIFLQTFYEKMGRAYLYPHEAGLRSLVKTVQGCAGLANEANECREFLHQQAKARLERLRGIKCSG